MCRRSIIFLGGGGTNRPRVRGLFLERYLAAPPNPDIALHLRTIFMIASSLEDGGPPLRIRSSKDREPVQVGGPCSVFLTVSLG